MAVDKKKVEALKPAVAKHLANIAAGEKALEELERQASADIEALVTEGGQMGPYTFNGKNVTFRKRADGRYLVKAAGEAL
jgi:hypothetical protein